MALDLGPLGGRQRPALGQDRLGHRDLADVVEDRARSAACAAPARSCPSLRPDRLRALHHGARVVGGVGVLGLQRRAPAPPRCPRRRCRAAGRASPSAARTPPGRPPSAPAARRPRRRRRARVSSRLIDAPQRVAHPQRHHQLRAATSLGLGGGPGSRAGSASSSITGRRSRRPRPISPASRGWYQRWSRQLTNRPRRGRPRSPRSRPRGCARWRTGSSRTRGAAPRPRPPAIGCGIGHRRPGGCPARWPATAAACACAGARSARGRARPSPAPLAGGGRSGSSGVRPGVGARPERPAAVVEMPGGDLAAPALLLAVQQRAVGGLDQRGGRSGPGVHSATPALAPRRWRVAHVLQRRGALPRARGRPPPRASRSSASMVTTANSSPP